MQALHENERDQSRTTSRTKPGHSKKLSIDTTFLRPRVTLAREVVSNKIRAPQSRTAAVIGLEWGQRQPLGLQSGSWKLLDRVDLEKSGFETSIPSQPKDNKDGYLARQPSRSAAPAFHKRIEKLRPLPLELDKEAAVIDRSVKIGTALSPDSMPMSHNDNHPIALTEITLAPTVYQPPTQQRQLHTPRQGLESTTPIIVLTPARDSFPLSPSPDDFLSAHVVKFRPTSSVYSRYTQIIAPHNVQNHSSYANGASNDDEHTPPVPSLPLCKNVPSGKGHLVQPNAPSFSTSTSTSSSSHASLCSDFSPNPYSATSFTPDNDLRDTITTSTRISEDHTSDNDDDDDDDVLTPLIPLSAALSPGLPTPQRARGWWNVLTSPLFSAKSGSFSIFTGRSPSLSDGSSELTHRRNSRSSLPPSLLHDSETTPMLGAAERLDRSCSSASSLKSSARSLMDGEQRIQDDIAANLPKRAVTAPAALNGEEEAFSIYRIVAGGEAEAYFDANRRFPSVMMDGKEAGMRSLAPEGWSPSQSVYVASAASPRERAIEGKGNFLLEAGMAGGRNVLMMSPEIMDEAGGAGTTSDRTFRKSRHDDGTTNLTAYALNQSVFHSPSADELATPLPPPPPPPPKPSADRSIVNSGLVSPPQPTRSGTQPTDLSIVSPLSATPVIQDAHMATFIGPDSSFGAPPREVLVHNSRTPSPSVDQPLPPVAPPAKPLGHVRQESFGLGITAADGGEVNGGERGSPATSTFVPPPPPPPPSAPSARSMYNDSSRSLDISEKYRDVDTSDDSALEKGHGTAASSDNDDSYVPWYRRFLWPLSFLGAALLALLVILLVCFIRPNTGASAAEFPIQASWLNTTGFPAVPVGVSTVAQPRLSAADNSCVSSQALWSCGAPDGNSGAAAGLPNFRMQILFRNGTLPANETALSSSSSSMSTSGTRRARVAAVVRRAAAPWAQNLFVASPSPPSLDEQRFLGQTTDNVTTAPFEGEETPFYISFLDAVALMDKTSNSKRDVNTPGAYAKVLTSRSADGGDSAFPYPVVPGAGNSGSTSASSFAPSGSTITTASTTGPSKVPAPNVQPNGQVISPQLNPLATAQPLRLFDRGKPSEHYGFYTYFTRTFHVDNANPSTFSSTSNSNDSSKLSSSRNGTYAVFFSETRFLVQIWTRRGLLNTATLLGSNSSSSAAGTTTAASSSANVLTAPGSFPYPVTMTIDRHGGDAVGKAAYVYPMDNAGKVAGGSTAQGLWIAEDRSVGGKLVNAAGVPGRRDGALTSGGAGIDGGTGGCMCQWATWT